MFPISRDPPEGGTCPSADWAGLLGRFPISRDPPEGGTLSNIVYAAMKLKFPISRDPPEGGTAMDWLCRLHAFTVSNF